MDDSRLPATELLALRREKELCAQTKSATRLLDRILAALRSLAPANQGAFRADEEVSENATSVFGL